MVYENLKAICTEKNITFKQIEDKAELGRGCLSRWKDEKVSPNIETLKKVANVLEVDIGELVKG